MIKYIFLLLIPMISFAWVSPNKLRSGYLEFEEEISKETIRTSYKSTNGVLSSPIIKTIFEDKENRVDERFNVPDYFKDSVYFWFSIYTQYTHNQVVIHDMNNLNLIYKVIDFTDIFKSDIGRFAKANLKTKLTKDYTKKLKRILKNLGNRNTKNLTTDENDILRLIVKTKAKIPKSRKGRKKFFKSLSHQLRTQSGQRNKIFQGVIRSLPYLSFLEKKIELFKVPKEILAIPFLESSFNPHAESKVNAAGIWQFMKYTNWLFMPRVSKSLDYRKNPFIATVAAMHLLKENRLILRRWDMAITAYNSGTKNLVNARKKYKKRKNIDLAFILKNYKSKSLGFASKNFYSEFLALVYTRAYQDTIFPIEGIENEMLTLQKDVDVYLAKCSFRPKRLYKLLRKSSPHFSDLNMHLLKPKKKYPRGTMIVSDINLTKRKYYKLSLKQLKAKFPKKYHLYIKNKKCGKIY